MCVLMFDLSPVPTPVLSVSMSPVLVLALLLLLAARIQAQAETLATGSPDSVARARIVLNINRYRRTIAKKKGPSELPGASNMMEVVNKSFL